MIKLSKNLFTIAAVCIFIIISCSSPAPENNRKDISNIPVEDIFAFAGKQLSRSVEHIRDGNQFPRYTKKDGTWETLDSHAWSSGFFAGCLWLMYEYTSDELWKEHAMKWTKSMEREKHNKENHNNGFMMMPCFGNGYRLTGNDRYREVLIESARSLASRYSNKVGCIKANEMKQWIYPVMVDTMVNIELLFWASKNGGDPSWYDMAETHALNTMVNNVRADGSTIQIIDCNPETGEAIGYDTLCGLSGDSVWSRGQGQALYGFTMAYRETNNPKLLETAQAVADYFIDNLPDDYVPYWDVKDPNIPDTIRDSSAAAIAAVGLFELSTHVKNDESSEKYKTAAVNILSSLSSHVYLAKGSNSYGILKHATWKKPSDPQADTSLIWGDYNYLEALMIYKKSISG